MKFSRRVLLAILRCRDVLLDAMRESVRHLHTDKEPMSGFDYKSVNTQLLLADILERATGVR